MNTSRKENRNGMPPRPVVEHCLAEVGAHDDDHEERQHDSEGGRGLQPAGIIAAAFVGHVLGDVGDGAAV